MHMLPNNFYFCKFIPSIDTKKSLLIVLSLFCENIHLIINKNRPVRIMIAKIVYPSIIEKS
jgi:hypothetical protein